MAKTGSRTERRWPPAAPFTGEPPKVGPGDRVEIRTAGGEWHPAVAASEPRYDFENGLPPHTYLTVAVESPVIFGRPVNWPAEDVRPAGSPEVATTQTETEASDA